MKKLMFAGIAALCATVVADSAIESQNVVGYKVYPCEAGIDNVGAAFTPFTQSGDWTCTTNVYDSPAAEGDIVMFLNTDIFDLDSYVFNGYNVQGEGQGWIYMTSDPNTGDPLNTPVANFTLAKGQVTYCQPADGVSGFTTSGEVESGTSATVQFLYDGFFEFVNPFPKATTLADLETFCQEGDVLMFLNFNIFDLDSYVFNGKENNVSKGWIYMTSDPNTGDPINEDVSDASIEVLSVGQGGYFQPGDGGNRTWTVNL